MPLPTITAQEQLLPSLKIWQQALQPLLTRPATPRTPFNLRAAGGAAGTVGIALAWDAVPGATGYNLQTSTNGDFSKSASVPVPNGNQNAYFDNTIVTGVTKWYRLQAARDTVASGWSAPIRSTSGNAITVFDQVSHTAQWHKPTLPQGFY